MRHDATGGNTLVTAERSAATERQSPDAAVRIVPVTLVAEATAPLCPCTHPLLRWSRVFAGPVRRVYWMCGRCLACGFLAFPGESSPCHETGEPLTLEDGALAEAVALSGPDDLFAIYIRHANDVYAQRSRFASIDAPRAHRDTIDGVRAELQERFELNERERTMREVGRATEHEKIMKKLRGRLAKRTAAVANRVAQQRQAKPSGEYAVVVRGSDIMVRLIYGLVDPMEPSRIRYIGQTIRGAHTRYLGHVGRPDQTPRGRWISGLIEAGRYPDMVLIEQVAAGADINAIEMHWIGEFWRRGEADLNASGPARVRAEVAP